MHVEITYNKNIHRLFHYHEQKVQRGVAEVLFADNYLKEKAGMTLEEKMYPFWQRASLNEEVRMRILHLILKFDPADKVSNDKMTMVAREYMQKMRWDKDPYIVYRHNDTLQPHAHIMLPKIQRDGKRLLVSLDDYRRSKVELRLLEQKHGLRPSDKATLLEVLRQTPLQKIRFGETPLWPQMNKILAETVPQYRFTTLDELNAVLRLYNMKASRGKADSFTYRNGGLIYIPLTDAGKETGSYLPASSFESKPTLKNLEKLFVQNRPLREPDRQRLTVTIDWTLQNKSLSLEAFRQALEKEKITTIIKRDTNGDPQNIWYIDQQSRAVFEGETLGPKYAAGEIAKRCVSDELYQSQQQVQKQQLKQKIS